LGKTGEVLDLLLREAHKYRLARISRQAWFGPAIYSNRFLSAQFSRAQIGIVNGKFTLSDEVGSAPLSA